MMTGLLNLTPTRFFVGRGGWQFPPLYFFAGWLAGWWALAFCNVVIAVNLLWYGLYIYHCLLEASVCSVKDLKALQLGQNPLRKSYGWHRLVYTAIICTLRFY